MRQIDGWKEEIKEYIFCNDAFVIVSRRYSCDGRPRQSMTSTPTEKVKPAEEERDEKIKIGWLRERLRGRKEGTNGNAMFSEGVGADAPE